MQNTVQFRLFLKIKNLNLISCNVNIKPVSHDYEEPGDNLELIVPDSFMVGPQVCLSGHDY
jgi:hypothetical protein